MMQAHKIRLDPNNAQATYFAQASGVARFSYNWALTEWSKQYEACKLDASLAKPSEAALRRQLNAVKREQFPWMLEVTKNAPQMAIMQLGAAFKNFFAGRSKYPVYRRKGVHDRFTITNDQFSVDDSRIRIPGLGWVRMREPLRFKGKIMSATISRVAKHWYASITVETLDETKSKTESQGAIGVDLGVSALATLSTGEKVSGPKAHKALMTRLVRLSRSLSRKQKGSENRKKAKAKLATLHAKIANIRNDSLHKLTTKISSQFDTIGIEDLNVKGMVKNRHLARAVSDMGFFEFRRQLTYKTETKGGYLFVVDRWYPSSKTCSCCGHKVEKLPLSVRSWTCSACSTEHDRDLNAAINLKSMAVSSVGSCQPDQRKVDCTVSVCGEEGSGLIRKNQTKPASVKQKLSREVRSVMSGFAQV